MTYPRNEKSAEEKKIAIHRRTTVRHNVIVAGLVFVIFWVLFMPVRFYQPTCENRYGDVVTVLDSRLSHTYQKSLLYALSYSEIPYFQLGERVLVPLNFGNILTRSLNDKTALDAAMVYADDHPDSEVAILNRAVADAEIGANPDARGDAAKDKLKCDLIKAVVNPTLK
ncbi:hypothetical protein L2D14_01590 [Thalassospiraceae bacterium LMO-JJ14]|nr:hypothetical protein L2D14_01590 [Thalassospiraceae bacterium LMO-JJ14]